MTEDTTPNLDETCFAPVDEDRLFNAPRLRHKPRILLLYGSLRARSFSRLVTEEAARILQRFGAETRTFNPSGLPLPDDAEANHRRFRNCAIWSAGARAWCGVRQNATAP